MIRPQASHVACIAFALQCGVVSAQAPVVVAPVVEREVATAVRFAGTVIPRRTAPVGSGVDGRVVEYLVDVGDQVRADDALARLRTETLQIELAAATADLTLREEQLKELQNGALPEEIEKAEAHKAAAKATVDYASANASRMKALFQSGQAVTKEQFEQAQTAAVEAAESLREAAAEYRLVKNGPRVEVIAQARARLALQQAQVDLIKDRISKHTIRAPFDGFVTKKSSEVGAWVGQGDLLVEVIELSEVEVEVHVVAAMAATLDVKASVRIDVPSVNEVLTGTVHRIIPKAERTTRTIPVRIRLKNPIRKGRPLLQAGRLVSAHLPTGRKTLSTLVPKDALVFKNGETVVFVVEPRKGSTDTFEVRSTPVRIGIADESHVQVSGKLRAGDRVVILGNERLQTGESVTVTSKKSKKR